MHRALLATMNAVPTRVASTVIAGRRWRVPASQRAPGDWPAGL